MGGEQELRPTTHVDQLRSEVSSLQEIVGHLVLLIGSVHKGEPNNFQLEHVRQKEKGAKQEDPSIACTTACRQKGEHNRVDFPSNKQQQQLEQEQKQLQEGQLRTAEPTNSLIADKQDAATDCSNNKQKQHTAASNKNSLGISKQDRPPQRPWRILVDTGAELSVAPRSFAAEIQLSPLEKDDLQLRTATGKAIETFGINTVQLLSQGFSFTMNFVIADVEQPLLGLGSLLREGFSLHLDSNLGHHLGSKAGDKIQLEQRGLQIYLVACPAELGLSRCMIGNLLQHSLVPDTKSLVQEVCLDEGGAKQSLPLDNLKQHRQPKNNQAIGQQTALPQAAKKKKNKKGQRAASKLRTMEKTRFIEEMQLALLSPEEDPKHSLDQPTAQDLSLRVMLSLSLMKRWQLTTTRVKTALPQEQPTNHLRELGLRKSLVHDQIFVGDQLCVMHHENHMLIGGAKLQQECFINKLSACMLLEDTKQLDEQTPLIFLGRSLEYNRAEKSISLTLPSAFYLELLGRYGLEDATATDSPRDELESPAPRWNNIILDADRTKLYKQTVGDLIWSCFSRPDIGFAMQQLSNSFRQPTEQDEMQLVSVLRYLKGTQHYGISLQPPRRW